MKLRFCVILLFLGNAAVVHGQSTFTEVYHIMQRNCATGNGCHNRTATQYFDATLSEADLHYALVEGQVSNPTAAQKGDRLVKPGYPARSFLLRKIAYGISSPLILESTEGSYMPGHGTVLKNTEIELVRQWILQGAPLTGNVVDTSLINTYYRVGGIDDTYPTHTPPPAGQGFQVYLGKLFVPPHTETEFNYKFDPRLEEDTEIYRYEAMTPNATHHFVFFRFAPGADANYPDGVRDSSGSSHGSTVDEISVGAGLWDEELPQNTAYFWPKGSVLDLNLHVRNTHSFVLGTDVYINIYTQPVGTAEQYMLTRNYPNVNIEIPNDGREHEFTMVARDTTEKRMWNIWMLYSHTHQHGIDYDIWQRNLDGTKGEQVYEGFYNQDYTFNQGYYGWGVDVPIRRFKPPFLQVDPRLGFIQTAKFVNIGPDTVRWGSMSSAEMMVMGFRYIYGDSLGPLTPPDTSDTISGVPAFEIASYFNFFPNPAQGSFMVNYILQRASTVSLALTNTIGETTTIFSMDKPAGNFADEIELGNHFSPGIYILTFRTEKQVLTKKIVLQ